MYEKLKSDSKVPVNSIQTKNVSTFLCLVTKIPKKSKKIQKV